MRNFMIRVYNAIIYIIDIIIVVYKEMITAVYSLKNTISTTINKKDTITLLLRSDDGAILSLKLKKSNKIRTIVDNMEILSKVDISIIKSLKRYIMKKIIDVPIHRLTTYSDEYINSIILYNYRKYLIDWYYVDTGNISCESTYSSLANKPNVISLNIDWLRKGEKY